MLILCKVYYCYQWDNNYFTFSHSSTMLQQRLIRSLKKERHQVEYVKNLKIYESETEGDERLYIDASQEGLISFGTLSSDVINFCVLRLFWEWKAAELLNRAEKKILLSWNCGIDKSIDKTPTRRRCLYYYPLISCLFTLFVAKTHSPLFQG